MRDVEAEALRQVESVIRRCGKIQPKFEPGTAQHTLLQNRVRAMQIAQSLLAEGHADAWTDAELLAALEPVASVIRKCEKARSKYEPGASHYTRFDGILQAMELVQEKIGGELQKRRCAE